MLGILFSAHGSASAQPAAQAKTDSYRVYIGTYTGPKSKGIYQCELRMAGGELSAPELAAETANPTFLAIHPNRKFLYAVNEIGNFGGSKAGAISAFAIDAASGKLTLLNQQSSRGGGPCHLVVDLQGKNVLAANYGGGSVVVLPIHSDGSLAEATAFVQHEGASADPRRQSGPHAHSINLDPAGRRAFAADLGLDKVLIYRFDADQGTLTANNPPAAMLAPGSGPRHLAFHPSGRFAYVINEMRSSVAAFAHDAEHGALKELHTVTTLPEGHEGKNSTAEVQVHPSGKFLYGSNRGHDTIAVFAIDESTGRLTPQGHTPIGGKTPRNFAIDPTGKFLLAEGQGSGTVVVFRIDPQTGALRATGAKIEVPSPVCIKLLPL